VKTVEKVIIILMASAALFLLVSIYVDLKDEKTRESLYIQEIEGYKGVIKEAEKRNDSLRAANQKILERIDVLKQSLDSNAAELRKAKNRLYHERRKFKEYTNAQKDSILRAFINSNQ